MTSLRMRVVEAGARAIGQLRFDETNRAHRQGFYETDGEWAEAALDAMLDCLTENADEVRGEIYELWAAAPGEPSDMLADLIEVLREDR